ncbi:MAG: polysaccharide biosynthesis protein [Ruminococcaceae bacterium]|nr:polysaccharide biosynthesis protein [Oscillospiraceae bacterium]
MKNKTFKMRNRYLFLLDILFLFAAYALAVRVILEHKLFWTVFQQSLLIAGVTAIVYFISFSLLGIYNTDWIHAAPDDYMRLFSGAVASSVFSMIFFMIIPMHTDLFLKLNAAANGIAMVLICATRFFIRFFKKLSWSYNKKNGKLTLIIGAGGLAVTLLRGINEDKNLNYSVVGLIDDAVNKQKQHIYGVSVLGTRNDIVEICKEKNIEEIIFAINNISIEEKIDILNICAQTGCKVKILPGFETSLEGGSTGLNNLREIKIEDLLERNPIVLDNQLIDTVIKDKTVFVTGGSGSIGSELCRQIIKYDPKKLVILDIYENTAYELENELNDNYPHANVEVLIASVRDKKRLDDLFKEYRPDVVFHAAAHKHVPLMEDSPSEAIKNNIFGTYNAALCSAQHGVKRFVMISTDKAVNPTNVMGASKRVCEMVVQALQSLGKTEFVAVRFGNVLGSNGSVIPRFVKQIEAGGPVTVTHPDIIRYFMTIPEAAQLVLQAASYAKGGEIFVLDMGKPVKIYDLAKKMISLSGYVPDVDIKITITGLRPGEKLYEELLMNEEGLQKTAHSKIFVGQSIAITLDELNEKLETLKAALDTDNANIKKVFEQVVPTYHITENK